MTAARIAQTAGDGLLYGIQPVAALAGNEVVEILQHQQAAYEPLAAVLAAPNVGNQAGLLFARKGVTSQQAATLASQPCLVVPAPGAGKIIRPVTAGVLYRAGTTPTTAATFGFGPSAANLSYLAVQLALGSADEFAYAAGAEPFAPIANLVNKPLYFCASIDTHAADPGSFAVYVLYYLLEA